MFENKYINYKKLLEGYDIIINISTSEKTLRDKTTNKDYILDYSIINMFNNIINKYSLDDKYDADVFSLKDILINLEHRQFYEKLLEYKLTGFTLWR